MPVLILFGFFVVYGIANIAENNHNSKRKYNKNDTDKMLLSMTGKSKKECKKIAKMYGGR